MNSTLENNSTFTNISTSCNTSAQGIMPLLSMLFRLQYKQRYELANNISDSSAYIPDQEILAEKIKEAEVCLKQALKRYSP